MFSSGNMHVYIGMCACTCMSCACAHVREINENSCLHGSTTSHLIYVFSDTVIHVSMSVSILLKLASLE